jgi:hypothetical protein
MWTTLLTVVRHPLSAARKTRGQAESLCYNPAEREVDIAHPATTLAFTAKTGAVQRSFTMAWLGNRPWTEDAENSVLAQDEDKVDEDDDPDELDDDDLEDDDFDDEDDEDFDDDEEDDVEDDDEDEEDD